MTLNKTFAGMFNSYELSELDRILEGLAKREEYASGVHNLPNGYATVKLSDVEDDEDGDGYENILIINVESGEKTDRNNVCKYTCSLKRDVLSERIGLKEKIDKVVCES